MPLQSISQKKINLLAQGPYLPLFVSKCTDDPDETAKRFKAEAKPYIDNWLDDLKKEED